MSDEQHRLSVHDLSNTLLSIKVAAELPHDGYRLADDADNHLEHVRKIPKKPGDIQLPVASHSAGS